MIDHYCKQSFRSLIFLAFLSACSVELLSFDKGFMQMDHHQFYWGEIPVTVGVTPEMSDEHRSALQNSMLYYNQIVGATLFLPVIMEVPKSTSRSVDVVVFSDTFLLRSKGNTSVWLKRPITGQIERCEVSFNPRYTGNRLHTIIRHELGHVLGLDHDYKLTDSLMYHYAAYDGRLRYLTDRDVARLQSIYGTR